MKAQDSALGMTVRSAANCVVINARWSQRIAPEVKTLRRKLTRLAAYQRAEPLGAELARVRVVSVDSSWGSCMSMATCAPTTGQRRIVLCCGAPPSGHAGHYRLLGERSRRRPAAGDHRRSQRRLDPAFPRILSEVRDAVGERRVTIVFDRGGWSPQLFHTMIEHGFDILTYREGKSRAIRRRFVRRAPSSTGAG